MHLMNLGCGTDDRRSPWSSLSRFEDRPTESGSIVQLFQDYDITMLAVLRKTSADIVAPNLYNDWGSSWKLYCPSRQLRIVPDAIVI